MHPLVTEIVQKHNPNSCNFIRVKAIDLLQAIRQTPEQLDGIWDEIYDELADNNIFVQPALCDVNPDEDVRVFRANGPLALVIIEALLPSKGGDEFLAQAISKLNQQARPNQPRQPRRSARANGDFTRRRELVRRRDQPPQSQNNRPAWRATPDPTKTDRGSHYTRPLE